MHIHVGIKMNRNKQIIFLLSLISIIIVPSLVSGAGYYSFEIGDSFNWFIDIEGEHVLYLNPDGYIGKNLYLKAQILERVLEGTPSSLTNIKIAPSFVGSSESIEDYWNSEYLNLALIQKQFYLFGMLFIPLEYSESLSYINYLDNNGFELSTTISGSVLTYESTHITHILKYNEKGILDSYVEDYGDSKIVVKRSMSLGGMIGLGVGGLVLSIGLIALTVIIIRRRRTTLDYILPEKTKPQPVQRFQKGSYTGTSPSLQKEPKQTLGLSSERALPLPFVKKQINRQFIAEASFGIIILLFIIIGDTIVSQSFSLHLYEINSSYQMWNNNILNFQSRAFDTNVFSIALCIITFILALISPLGLDENLSQEELLKNIIVKVCFLVTGIFALIAFIIQRSTIGKLIEGLYDELELLLLKLHTAYIFEVLAFIMLLVLLFMFPLIYKNSDLFSFYKPAFYVLTIGLTSFVITGFIASSFYRKIVLDSFLTEESIYSQYRTGAIFSEISFFLITLSLMIWAISIARKRGIVLASVTIFLTIITIIFIFMDNYFLLQYNLSDIYFELVLYEDVLQRHQAFSNISLILFLFVIFLGISFRLHSFSLSQESIPSDIAGRRFTPQERMMIASAKSHQGVQEKTVANVAAGQEQSDVLKPIRISLCPVCEQMIEEDSQFCRHCGSQLDNKPDRRKKS